MYKRQQFGAIFVGVDRSPCDLCGFPDPKVPGMHLLMDGEPEPEKCLDCGHAINGEGHTLVTIFPDGQMDLSIITLVFRPMNSNPSPRVPVPQKIELPAWLRRDGSASN